MIGHRTPGCHLPVAPFTVEGVGGKEELEREPPKVTDSGSNKKGLESTLPGIWSVTWSPCQVAKELDSPCCVEGWPGPWCLLSSLGMS